MLNILNTMIGVGPVDGACSTYRHTVFVWYSLVNSGNSGKKATSYCIMNDMILPRALYQFLLVRSMLHSQKYVVLAVERVLDPDTIYYNPGESRFTLRGSYARESEPWTILRRRHPEMCLTSDRIYRKLFLVALKEDADSEMEMAICKTNWDADPELGALFVLMLHGGN